MVVNPFWTRARARDGEDRQERIINGDIFYFFHPSAARRFTSRNKRCSDDVNIIINRYTIIYKYIVSFAKSRSIKS